MCASYLAQVHNDGLMNFLPQVCPENLNERDLKRGNFAVHEDAREVELHLEADVNVRAIDSRRPPKGKASIRDLQDVETHEL